MAVHPEWSCDEFGQLPVYPSLSTAVAGLTLLRVLVGPRQGTGPMAGRAPGRAEDRELMADDAGREVLGGGPFPLIKLDGHLFLLDLAEVSRIGASPDSCQTPEGGGTVNRTACGGMMLCAGRGSMRAELARVEGPGQRIMPG
jgi:hypothetical protein